VLEGRTFKHIDSGKQWFDNLVIRQDGKAVLNVTAMQDGGPKMGVSQKQLTSRVYTEELEITEGGIRLGIKPSVSHGHHRATLLNVRFTNAIPNEANGIFAELAGLKTMSDATRVLLKKPVSATSATGSHGRSQALLECVCPEDEAP